MRDEERSAVRKDSHCPNCRRWLTTNAPLCDCDDHCVVCCPYLAALSKGAK